MNKFLIAVVAMLLPLQLLAQYQLSGHVRNATSKEGLAGATVVLERTQTGTTSGTNGSFSFNNLPAGAYTLKVSFLGFEEQRVNVNLQQDTDLNITLRPKALQASEVVVQATRADERTGTTFTNVTREEIEERNFGQDLPYLLEQTPSVVVNSDAGAGVGYTGIRIRGSDITRINVTVNGIPVNDSESHGVFFVNMPDFASSVQDIQVQRGVGTSTNGAGAFGASINIQTERVRREAYAETDNSYGSFDTWKNNVRFGTGLINGKFAFDGRLSRIKSDGYIDRASSDLKSLYFAGGYYGDKTTVKFITFSGQEQTYQAWYGTPEALVYGNAQDLKDYIDRNYIEGSDRENLLRSGRTYNYYTYDNETDNYQQDHYQLHLSHDFVPGLSFSGALHYTYGRGYYEQFRAEDDLEDYGLPNVEIGSEVISTSDLIRRRWLDNDFYGATYALQYNPNQRLNATLGGAWNRYDGSHFGEIIWARYASTSNIRDRYYDNDGQKTDFNIFAKASYGLTDKLSLFGDLQLRTVKYEFLGFDNDGDNITQTADFTFWNPKAGITYSLQPEHQFYTSFAVGNREPVRDDFTESTPESRPKHETLRNVEAGYRGMFGVGEILGQGITADVEANYFYMNYQNQLVLTGQINDVGAYTRTNIDKSYRQGVEFSGALRLGTSASLRSNISFSENKIQGFSEFLDDYETGDQVRTDFRETTIAFSPDWVTATQLEVEVLKGLRAALIYKTVSQQYLDNTENDSRAIPAYQVGDVRLRYNIKFENVLKELELGLLVNNVFNEKYAANGYTYSYIYGEQYTENFYYPQALRNFLLSVGLKF
ncbi:TonB-dependent receptor [Pontibacter akesuensis]|uniref:Iron complex outermembrane recepter protein n=1 Tax=Pontibacter akesuensis TaxID=388950 RepID=A0A1I7JFA9_9BACT|nr:TonB-dependent receptor [Pontibacter akesuensis]GHA70375.1 TonB-dependent receptor [Pontibacter akesuensis]SFU83840.1 iron complex outermembrane recepter protein [Pontibacter akesuensis]